jgi:hypothetical protein
MIEHQTIETNQLIKQGKSSLFSEKWINEKKRFFFFFFFFLPFSVILDPRLRARDMARKSERR